MRPIVFLGPSLSHAEAAGLLAADYRPPAAAGDLFTAARRAPPAIVLIDGYFERRPAVWHKEVLYAIERGIAVYGAASMGALRAAELHTFGMIGVGSIFARYRDGEFEDDDEVAVRHVGEGFAYQAVSDAMVNLRDGLALAVAATVIEPREAEILSALAKAMFYPTRSWQALVRAGGEAGLDAARLAHLLDFVLERRPNSKRDDARAVLTRVALDLAAPRAAPPPDFAFERSIFWERLVESLGGDGGGAADDSASTVAWAKLCAPGGDWQVAIGRHLLRLEARRREWQAQAPLLEMAIAEFRRAHGLEDDAAFAAWCATQGVDAPTVARLAQDELLRAELDAVESRGIEQAFVDQLKARGVWADLAAASARQDAAARALGDAAPQPARAGFDLAELLGWYAEKFRPVGADLARHARELGFPSSTEFLVALTRARLAAED